MKPDPEIIGEHLRAKIASKFQITGTLAGLGFATLGIQLTLLYQENVPRLLPQSIALIFSAVCLFGLSLYRLDGLTMPKRFWEHSTAPAPAADTSFELTDANLVSLMLRMVFLWTRMSLVAIVLTCIGLSLLVAPLDVEARKTAIPRTFWWTLIVMLATTLYCVVLYRWEKHKEATDRTFGRLLKFID